MCVRVDEIAAVYTRSIHTVGRNDGSSVIQCGAANLFFRNGAKMCVSTAPFFTLCSACMRTPLRHSRPIMAFLPHPGRLSRSCASLPPQPFPQGSNAHGQPAVAE